MYSLDWFYVGAFASILTGSLFALLLRRRPATVGIVSCSLLLCGLFAGLIPVFSEPGFQRFFQLPVLVLGGAAGIHSLGYLRGHGSERSGLYWCFFNLTVAAMLGVLKCERPLAFLVMWELMGLSSFVLTSFDYRREETVRAAWIYLLSCQAGAMFLIPLFVFQCSSGWAFALALIGFGFKAGFPLLHVWLPEAHPAAPAPVSALMSGAMIQLGFYGILRWGISGGADAPSALYGYTLLAVGMAGCFMGVLFALPCRNLKALLAYSSIENMGIIAMGLGFGFLGRSYRAPLIAFCGFGGAALHMCNHALLKGGLFLLAGSVQRAAGTLDMDRMGGLLRKMPHSGTLFLLNAMGLSGLPPFNAFVSEFLIYCAALYTLTADLSGAMCVFGVSAAVVLALSGGLAAAVFSKASGAVFLGMPRSAEAESAGEVSPLMILPVLVLFLIGLLLIAFPVAFVGDCIPEAGCAGDVGGVSASLGVMRRFCLIAAALFGALLWLRFRLLPGGGETRRVGTWDCGYAAPDARMEYTATAFSQPQADFFRALLSRRKTVRGTEELFTGEPSYEEEVSDPGMAGFWERLFGAVARLAERVHILQSGYLHLYILIMTLTLIAMLVWGLILPWSGSLIGRGA